MARFPSLLSRRNRQPETSEAAPDEAPAVMRRPPPAPGQLRRERRALLRVREERIRDLGGLMLEMYRQDAFREDLLLEHCAELLSLESRLGELEQLLSISSSGRRGTGARCSCGAPILWGSHFCANCGRPAGDAPVVSCPSCGHPLPGDARFCVSCGSPIATGDAQAYEASAESQPEPTEAERAVDRWER